mmetsp:Transcript_13020/g.33217  ORF Transcript_13020/g.33217 Transcript_13020/m.33217 type:complete len:155 (-) Transcript_13020:155-619(-)|eukprot:CAMPEP_0174235494 /NCGR_PEP_ID=MMETSP0417-20130205/4918_1 /TAXON_ID=242541 /ORGANISM="Mayorella sp, Strain BSH-02190019" /LENGTH=154 /DNA_ID=CAMNT_0015314003 /DNA_START=71 /DNA_END=535 /DNA_ORIENTATION=-
MSISTRDLVMRDWGSFLTVYSVPANAQDAINRVQNNPKYYLAHYACVVALVYVLAMTQYQNFFAAAAIIGTVAGILFFVLKGKDLNVGGVQVEFLHKVAVTGFVSVLAFYFSESLPIFIWTTVIGVIVSVIHSIFKPVASGSASAPAPASLHTE